MTLTGGAGSVGVFTTTNIDFTMNTNHTHVPESEFCAGEARTSVFDRHSGVSAKPNRPCFGRLILLSSLKSLTRPFVYAIIDPTKENTGIDGDEYGPDSRLRLIAGSGIGKGNFPEAEIANPGWWEPDARTP